MLKRLNLNWSAVWRKSVAGAVFAALMGYTYKANKNLDNAIDARYPAPKDEKKDSTETS